MIPTANISDALDYLGLDGQLADLRALVPGLACAGPAFTVRFAPVDDPGAAPAADYLAQAPEGSVIVIDNGGRSDCTVWGGLLSAFACRRRIAGTVIWGVCRDLSETRKLEYPMFALHPFMRTGKGRVRLAEVGGVVRIAATVVHPGDWIVADDDGVVRVPQRQRALVEEQARRVMELEERILADLQDGLGLAEARRRHRYNQFRPGGSDGRR